MDIDKIQCNFRERVFLIHNCSNEEAVDYIVKTHGKKYKDDDFDNTELGWTWRMFYKGKWYFYIWLKGKNKSTMWHECLHLVYSICNCIGIELSDETEEVFTYMQEDFARQIIKITNNKGGLK